MKGILSKIVTGVCLAVAIALAIPLGLMTASIVRGESPRQLAAQELEDGGGEEGEPADDTVVPISPPDESRLSVQPEVQPEPEPAPVKTAPARKSGSAQKKQPAAKSAAPKNTNELPKAVLAPGEAPCMVDGLDGYSYDY